MSGYENIDKNMLPLGTMLRSGTYKITRQLSSGGFGNTYVATNVEFDEVVAIKEFFMKGLNSRDGETVTVSVPANKSTFESQKEKFKKEARRLRQLRNPYIVRVHDLFEERGTVYYVMDFIDGESLSEHLNRTGKPLSEEKVRTYLPQILEALNVVHTEGFYHLDLKPGNIMLDKQDCIHLIDFGASKQEDKDGGAKESSVVCYTAGYAPIEQNEQNMKKFGPWTDIYALGATLYTLLTNTRPPDPTDIYEDQTPDKHQTLPFPSNVSGVLREMIIWMMAFRRGDRPQSVQEIQQRYFNWRIIPSTEELKGKEHVDVGGLEDTIAFNKEVEMSDSTPINDKRKPKNKYKMIVGFLIVAALVIGGYYLYNHGNSALAVPADIEEDDPYSGHSNSLIDTIIWSLTKYLDEKNSVEFNHYLKIVNDDIEEALRENPKEAINIAEAVRYFITTNAETIKNNLGYSSETIQETEELTKGTIQEFIQAKAKKIGVELPADSFEENGNKNEYKSEKRIW